LQKARQARTLGPSRLVAILKVGFLGPADGLYVRSECQMGIKYESLSNGQTVVLFMKDRGPGEEQEA
jgi:hypothetical protein